MNIRNFMQPLCRAYIQRAETLGFAPKPGNPASKKCEDDCIAYFQGAQNVLAINNLEGARYMEQFCLMILQVRGFSEVALLAEDKWWEAREAERNNPPRGSEAENESDRLQHDKE